MLAKLAGSSYLKPGGADGKRTEALDYAGNPLTANAHTLLDYGREGLEAYEKKVREGQWDSGKTRPRMAFFMEEEQHDELMRTRREARKKTRGAAGQAVDELAEETAEDVAGGREGWSEDAITLGELGISSAELVAASRENEDLEVDPDE